MWEVASDHATIPAHGLFLIIETGTFSTSLSKFSCLTSSKDSSFCGYFNENGPHRLISLNVWFLVEISGKD